MPDVRRILRHMNVTNERAVKRASQGSEVVYCHGIRGEPGSFHIGSGSEQRARQLTKRSAAWNKFVAAHGGTAKVEVEILERYDCPARARLREMELVRRYQPSTNVFGRSSTPAAILAGHPKGSVERCNCGAPDCYGAELASHDDQGRANVRDRV